MIRNLIYQNKAIEEITRFSSEYLKDEPKIIIFQAPTGSGKTIMMADSISRLVKQVDNAMPLAFIWISVNSLHEQSKEKLDEYFEEEKLIDCISVEEIQDNQIQQNQILFVNWEKLNKENNLFIQENEKDWNLSTVIENTKYDGKKIVLIIDESHRTAKTDKSKELIALIDPDLTIEVSATPKEAACDHKVNISLKDVIAEGMIKESIEINPNLEKAESNEDVLQAALRRRKQLQKAYQDQGKDINPLLLIQIPNRKSTDIRSPEQKIIELLHKFDVNEKNGKLAIWLSDKDKKINLADIERNNCGVEVLLFKQAIALGWDCPRAAILLLQREWNQDNYEFNIQTLGRIMRMPEHKHYEKSPELNIGYVYSASKNFSIIEELAKDYVSTVQMKRDNKIYKSVHLPNEFIRRKRELTRLSSDFKPCLLEASKELKLKDKLNVALVEHKKDIVLKGNIGNIDNKQIVTFSGLKKIRKDKEEIFNEYNDFIAAQTSPFSKVRSTEILKTSVRAFFKQTFDISDEDKIASIVLNPVNQDEIMDLIEKAKERYLNLPVKKDEIVISENWQVPDAISVFNNYEETKWDKTIMKPYFAKKNKNGKVEYSKPELEFIEKLEDTDNDILWWFKNGQKESKFFGIAYKKEDGYYGFYPDFLIRTKKELLIIEVKDNKNFVNENLLKLNAGKDYLKKYKGSEKLYFFIVSPQDYVRFFRALKEQNISDFKSKYEEQLARNAKSRQVIAKENVQQSKEDKELLDLYDTELSKAIKNLEDKKLENELLKMNLEDANTAIRNFEEGYKSLVTLKRKEQEPNLNEFNIPKPFNICILGEVVDEDKMRRELNKFFAKFGLKTMDWEIDIFNNVKLRNSNVLNAIKKGQSKFSLVITGQIHHHSGKGNTSANLLTELKKDKYVRHIVGSSPKDLLTIEALKEGLNSYISQNFQTDGKAKISID